MPKNNGKFVELLISFARPISRQRLSRIAAESTFVTSKPGQRKISTVKLQPRNEFLELASQFVVVSPTSDAAVGRELRLSFSVVDGRESA